MTGASTAFPTLRITIDGFEAQGSFAEAQAAWLNPDQATVARLDELLADCNVGVLAHFYMDPELQGTLGGCGWPHIHISDSLAMADRGIAMAESGVSALTVLGVDFMSENVRAMLDAVGHDVLPVHRVARSAIGCSLAESAEALAYGAWLQQAAQTPRSLHVIYINTSLMVKARAHALVPTLTCTSSNVVQTVLQAFAQVPELTLWFGPDTFMGNNLRQIFASAAELDDAAIAALHPAHDRASLRRLLAGLRTFEQGVCVVHHMFGADVTRRVREELPDAFYTAHLEVPGEMFALAAEAALAGRGVVGSTSDILNFIGKQVDAALAEDKPATLPFVLGTEAGMVTAIVRNVRQRLLASGRTDVVVDIIFPVAAEAIAATGEADLALVPGVLGGEGCTPAGGCATCPYMKMNSLDALLAVLELIKRGEPGALADFAPRTYAELIGGRSAADLGSEPILFMRHLQRTGRLPEALIASIRAD